MGLELICFRAQAAFHAAVLRRCGAAGKSLLVFRNRVKPIISDNQKYSASVFTRISGMTPAVSPRT
jgi:hypothetical protein